MYSAASFIVNVSLRWIGTRTLFSIHNGNSFSSLPLIDTPLYCKLQGVFRSLSFIGFFPFQIFIKKSFNQTIVSCNLTGSFTPARFSRSPTHCLRRFERSDYGYKGVSLCILRVVAHKLLHLFHGAVLVAHSLWESHGAPAVWLGARGTYLICPMLRRRYLASLSLSRNKKAG